MLSLMHFLNLLVIQERASVTGSHFEVLLKHVISMRAQRQSFKQSLIEVNAG